MPENAATKAERLVAHGRVTVRTLNDDVIEATVRGDTARVYSVRWDHAGWWDDCEAMTPRCSHIRAVQLVVLEPTPGDERNQP